MENKNRELGKEKLGEKGEKPKQTGLRALQTLFHDAIRRVLGEKNHTEGVNPIPTAEWEAMDPKQKHMAGLWLSYKDPTPDEELASIHARIDAVHAGKPVLNKAPTLTVLNGGVATRKKPAPRIIESDEDQIAG